MNPILIAGVALVGLPVLLHLIMKQEPKRLTFPAFRFLTQKLKTNQRKMRLRHFLLLALRMLLIALFCLTLYQPTLLSERFGLVGDQPIAAVIIIDTSPSMGYTADQKSRLEEAKRRALELLDTLPDKSPISVIETDELSARWMDISEARKQIERIDKPRGGTQPVTSAIAVAYQQLAKIEGVDAEDAERFQKLIAVFTDRTAASWEASRVEDLKKLRETLPDPKPAYLLFDVGADHPTNVAILAAEMKPQVISANQRAIVTVTVAATGPATEPPVEVTVQAKLDSANAESKRVMVPYGQSRAVTFEFAKNKPGVHQVEFTLAASDKLMVDNARFLTFKVGAARRILTIADNTADAAFWQLAHNAKEEFGALVVTPSDLTVVDGGRTEVSYDNPEKPGSKLKDDIREFDVVTLLSVRDPSEKIGLDSLWDKLRPYVINGGKLIVIPGESLSVEGYTAASDLLPATFVRVLSTRDMEPPPPLQTAWDPPRDGRNGVTWMLDAVTLQHPMLREMQGWKANVDGVKNPPRVWRFWEVQKAPEAAVIVRYNDSDKPAERRPAVLERAMPDPKDQKKTKGRVLLLTTRMDVPPAESAWHDYWETEGASWSVVFPFLLARYLAGDTADANFNFLTGQTVTVALPKGGVPRGATVVIDGSDPANPFITGDNALIEVGDRQTELRISPPRANLPGNFLLSVAAVRWNDGFSLNAPAEESVLEKVAAETIEDLMGKDSVVPLEKNRDLRETLADGGRSHPIDLYPWLLIAVLLLLSVESFISNRFYRRVR